MTKKEQKNIITKHVINAVKKNFNIVDDFNTKKSIKNSLLQLISYILVRFSLSILFFLQGKKQPKIKK